jgi:very-short-patch-repair endonuclease
MSYIGWSEDWFDDLKPKVNETIIKYFVNRYFAYPEDWDDDDIPLIMIWVRCLMCGDVQEHFMKETEDEWENFIYNGDNTYTSLSNPECFICENITSFGRNNPEKIKREIFLEKRKLLVEEEYQDLLAYEATEKKLQFESAIEDYFWKAWRTTFPDFTLISQYQIGSYYVDFAHLPTRTAIELDGKAFHTAPNQIANDLARQKKIEQQGWRFIRFKGGKIYHDIDKCILETMRFLSQVDSELITDVYFQWRSSPSARLLTRLKEEYWDFIGDVP